MNAPDSQRRLDAQHVLDALTAATCVVGPDGVVLAVNAAWRDAATTNGGDPQDCAVGANYLAVCDRVDPDLPGPEADDQADAFGDARDVAGGLRSVLAGSTTSYQRTYPCHSNDSQRWFSVHITPLQLLDGPGTRGALVSHHDISSVRQTEQALDHQSHHDALTGLANGALLSERLEQALANGRRHGTHVAVAFLDLDHFKRVNDSLGHAGGDALLREVANRLHGAVRDGDTLARYAGDEFIVMWVDLESQEQARRLSDRCTEVLEPDFDLDGRPVQVSASIGVTIAAPGQSAADVLQDADAAMYAAKRHGRGGVRMFSTEMRLGLAERLSTELDLRGALERDELVLHYQPVIDLTTGRPVAVEALTRWQHPRRGLLMPEAFIQIAEDCGLILPLGRWVLQAACRDAADPTGPLAGLDVAVNLSVRQLGDPGITGHVRAALSASGLEPGRLLLEVTESAVIEDERAAALALEELAALGVRIALDDFGTGWSSLLYLRRYPVTALKIDRAFVSGLGGSQDDEAICDSVISLANAVGATCIAEGVETLEHYAILRSYGCHLGQGYLWSRPVALADLADALATAQLIKPGTKVTRRRRRSDNDPLRSDAAHRIWLLHSDGASLLTIAAALNREQFQHPAGVRWTATAVARYLAA